MKFNKEGFLFIAMGMLAVISLYYAFISRESISSLFSYLALALLFSAGSYYFKKNTKFEEQEDKNKIVKKDRIRKRNR